MNKRPDFQGMEFDWFAIDTDGFIAIMSTAGYGPIPDAVFERLDKQRQIEAALGKIINSPTSGDLRRVEHLLSVAGVFAFDWKHWAGPYQRFTVPLNPRRLDELGIPHDLHNALVAIPERFSNSNNLRPEISLPCSSQPSNQLEKPASNLNS